MTKIGDKMWAINTVRPFGATPELKSTSYCHTEDGKDRYIKHIVGKFGEKSIISVIEYVVTNVK